MVWRRGGAATILGTVGETVVVVVVPADTVTLRTSSPSAATNMRVVLPGEIATNWVTACPWMVLAPAPTTLSALSATSEAAYTIWAW